MGMGRLAYLVAVPAWGDACPVRITAGSLWFLEWLKVNKGRYGHMSSDRAPEKGGDSPGALFTGVARARSGFGMAAAVIRAATKKAFGGRTAFPKKGGRPPLCDKGYVP